MPFKKGHSGNPTGRKPKPLQEREERKDLRKSINEFLLSRFDEVVTEWEHSTGKEKMNFYRDLIRYVLSPLQSVELENTKQENTKSFFEQINEMLIANTHKKRDSANESCSQ